MNPYDCQGEVVCRQEGTQTHGSRHAGINSKGMSLLTRTQRVIQNYTGRKAQGRHKETQHNHEGQRDMEQWEIPTSIHMS